MTNDIKNRLRLLFWGTNTKLRIHLRHSNKHGLSQIKRKKLFHKPNLSWFWLHNTQIYKQTLEIYFVSQEYFEDNLMRAMESSKIREVSEGHETPTSMPQFDMKEAVEVSLFHKNEIINQIGICILILSQHDIIMFWTHFKAMLWFHQYFSRILLLS